MRTIKYVLFLSALWMGSLGCHAQENTHWQCDIYSYQYDMTVYFHLKANGVIVKNYNDFEVAAFVGSECRGVGEFQTTSGNASYGYLRVRSNVTEGEQVTFKVYQKSIKRVLEPTETLDFVNLSRTGLPSTPFILQIPLLGDVNGDDKVSIFDAVQVVNYIIGNNPEEFNESLADVDGNGRITIFDAVSIVNIILNQDL